MKRCGCPGSKTIRCAFDIISSSATDLHPFLELSRGEERALKSITPGLTFGGLTAFPPACCFR